MFQSLERRELAEQQHICTQCTKSNDCDLMPESTNWRYVLTQCEPFEEKVTS